MKKFLKPCILLICILVIVMVCFTISFASGTTAAKDSAVTLYADYGKGYELLTKLYFEDYVTEQTIEIVKPIKSLRVVKGVCYELNLDRLTLNGAYPAGYERKLSATDNDLIEVVDSADFELNGFGELVISARTPIDILGEQYSFKFPSYNHIMTDVKNTSFYHYDLGSKVGSFSRDTLVVPNEEYKFVSKMCYPDSGHPDALMDIYVANDDDNLYVFFEAFGDNTFDHGKDFAGVHIKCGDEIKSYKVHTVESNDYGRWWFDYTDSSEEYDWEHMNYVVIIPLSEIKNDSNELEIGFEYYGTMSIQEELYWLAVGDILVLSKERYEEDIYYAELNDRDPYYTDVEYFLPDPGKTVNDENGDTAEGTWWITNTGTEEKNAYTLYLNNATIDTFEKNHTGGYAYLYPWGSLTVELVEGSTNTIGTLSTDDHGYEGLDISNGLDFVIQGKGTLNVYSKEYGIAGWNFVNLTICKGAIVNVYVENNKDQYDTCRGVSLDGDDHIFIIDNAVLNVNVNSGFKYNYGINWKGDFVLNNDAVVEVSTSGGEVANYGLFVYGVTMTINYDPEVTILKEGTNADDAEEVDEFTNTYVGSYRFGTTPYILINQDVPNISKVEFEVTNLPVGGQKGIGVTVQYDSDEYIIFADNYAASLSDGEEAEWFGGTYVAGTTYVGRVTVEPEEGYFFDEDVEVEVTGGTLVKSEESLNEEEKPILLVYFEVEAEEPEEAEMCTITFNANGGTGNMSGESVEKGSKYKLPKPTFKAPKGKVFSQWEINGKKYRAGSSITVEENIEAKATWTTTGGGGGVSNAPIEYKIEIKAEGANVSPATTTIKKGDSQKFTFSAEEGSKIVDVIIDGKSVGVVDSYAFENVREKHTIEIKTEKIPSYTNTSDWSSAEMKKADEYGLVPNSLNAKDFTLAISREEFAGIAVRLYEAISGKKAEVPSKNPFEDTTSIDVLKAYALGITKGISDKEFGNGPITREQLVTMIMRAIEAAGVNTTMDVDAFEKFIDDGLMHEWSRRAIYWMTGHEIIKGMGDKSFGVKENCTIEQALAIAVRCVELWSTK